MILEYSDLAHPQFEIVTWFQQMLKLYDLGRHGLDVCNTPKVFILDQVLDDHKARSEFYDCFLPLFEWVQPSMMLCSEDSSEWDSDGDEESYVDDSHDSDDSANMLQWVSELELNTVHTTTDLNALQHNTARIKGGAPEFDWLCPKPIVIVVSINGQKCRVLVDTGLLVILCQLHWQVS